jgi:hypothetical protein
MIMYCAEKITSDDMLINGGIEAIIQHSEECTADPNSKYEGLNLEDDSSLQQREGENFWWDASQLEQALVIEAREEVELFSR